MTSNKWTVADIPDQSGKVVFVTGANSGLGYETSLALAAKGAHVILTSRTLEKGETAAQSIRQQWPRASLEVLRLDLADLTSIRDLAETFCQRYDELHILCNNAGVMATPYLKTVDGFEMQFGTNHLGHFALTGLLLKPLLKAEKARVVNVSSAYHRLGKLNFADLQREKSYKKWAAYSDSKLANLLFTYELQRKLEANNSQASSIAAHPGYAATKLQSSGPKLGGFTLDQKFMVFTNRFLAQSQQTGALPQLYAATAIEARGGDYIGLDGFMELRGHPKKVQPIEAAYNEQVAAKLWSVSETLTGVVYEFL